MIAPNEESTPSPEPVAASFSKFEAHQKFQSRNRTSVAELDILTE
jgi:hypothetical protein